MIENVLTFTTAVLILFTSLGIAQMCNWSVIHGIKRKPHLSVVWNWYHFVAIAILHQPRPTDSADINTRLQLSDTSSIPPMHGGFLLLPCVTILPSGVIKTACWTRFNRPDESRSYYVMAGLVRPSARLSTYTSLQLQVPLTAIHFSFTFIIYILCLIRDTGNGTCSLSNVCILIGSLVFAF